MDREVELRRRIGERLRAVRQSKRLLPEEVVERADLHSKQYLSDVESGRRGARMETLLRIAEDGLGSDLSEIFQGVTLGRTNRTGEASFRYRAATELRWVREIESLMDDVPAARRVDLMRIIRVLFRLVRP